MSALPAPTREVLSQKSAHEIGLLSLFWDPRAGVHDSRGRLQRIGNYGMLPPSPHWSRAAGHGLRSCTRGLFGSWHPINRACSGDRKLAGGERDRQTDRCTERHPFASRPSSRPAIVPFPISLGGGHSSTNPFGLWGGVGGQIAFLSRSVLPLKALGGATFRGRRKSTSWRSRRRCVDGRNTITTTALPRPRSPCSRRGSCTSLSTCRRTRTTTIRAAGSSCSSTGVASKWRERG